MDDKQNIIIYRTADGKAKATVAPDAAPTAFFLRVKVNTRIYTEKR